MDEVVSTNDNDHVPRRKKAFEQEVAVADALKEFFKVANEQRRLDGRAIPLRDGVDVAVVGFSVLRFDPMADSDPCVAELNVTPTGGSGHGSFEVLPYWSESCAMVAWGCAPVREGLACRPLAQDPPNVVVVMLQFSCVR